MDLGPAGLVPRATVYGTPMDPSLGGHDGPKTATRAGRAGDAVHRVPHRPPRPGPGPVSGAVQQGGPTHPGLPPRRRRGPSPEGLGGRLLLRRLRDDAAGRAEYGCGGARRRGAGPSHPGVARDRTVHLHLPAGGPRRHRARGDGGDRRRHRPAPGDGTAGAAGAGERTHRHDARHLPHGTGVRRRDGARPGGRGGRRGPGLGPARRGLRAGCRVRARCVAVHGCERLGSGTRRQASRHR